MNGSGNSDKLKSKQAVWTDESYEIFQFVMPVVESNMFVVVSSEEKTALIIDPHVCEDACDLLNQSGVESVTVLLTHEHYDHISGANWLKTLFNTTVICNQICATNIENPTKNFARYFEVIFPEIDMNDMGIVNQEYSCQADIIFENNYNMKWGKKNIVIKSAPGHSPGGELIQFDDNLYFSGDNLLTNGNGVIDCWPGGSRKAYLEETKTHIYEIDDNSYILPGHGQIMKFKQAKEYLFFYRDKALI